MKLSSTGLLRARGLAIACLLVLAGCASVPGSQGPWEVLEFDQVKRIAEIRSGLDEMRLAFRDVLILRMTDEAPGEEQKRRVDVSSIGPTIVSKVKDGAPAARTTFGFSEKRDRLVMLTQDVPNRRAYHREIPVAELTEGKSFRFPVVQESGEVREATFTVQQLIVR